MKFRACLWLVVSLLCAGPALSVARAQGKTNDDYSFQRPSPDETQSMLKRWQETMKSGKYHRWLGQLVGEWETTTRLWWTGEGGGESMSSKGQATISWQVKDKWLQLRSEGKLMGTPLQSFGLQGYDNFKNKFVAIGYDSMSTALYRFEGTLDKSGKTLRLWGTVDEPMTGEHDKMAMHVTRIKDPDNFVIEIHDLTGGASNTKVVEIKYVRKK